MIGVGIVSFNRPFYLRRMLKTLEAQTELDAEFHLLQDGAVNVFSDRRKANDFDITRCVEIFNKAKLPRKEVHQHEQNVGIYFNQREGIEMLCERYDRVMMIEDDVLLSPHWFRLARILFDQLPDHPDVFGFSPGFRRMCEMDKTLDNLGYVQTTTQHLWTECFTPQAWREIQPHMQPYYDLVSECDYGQRPRDEISKLHLSRGATKGDTSQDWARVVAIQLSGMRRVQCTVNRGMSIGMQGVNFNVGVYNMLKLGDQRPFEFESDAAREGFDWLAPQN